MRVARFIGRDRTFTTEEQDMLLESPAGQQILQMTKYSAVGTAAEVKEYLDRFAERAQADELIVVSSATDRKAWLRTLELVAQAGGLTG
jgi:alkanesulfonate monooxygenase SsuD/methylene tetrahydromethanopterin reductase-like flavin-dependent oxidoreductase (luciferase family)